jgi:STE24 endopeptidase
MDQCAVDAPADGRADSARAQLCGELVAGVVLVFAAPTGLIGNRLSRAVERRADGYSLELTGASDAFVSFERQIALQNIADLDPPRWVSALATHPPTAERMALALSYAAS